MERSVAARCNCLIAAVLRTDPITQQKNGGSRFLWTSKRRCLRAAFTLQERLISRQVGGKPRDSR
eukprot:5806733-Pyramimonas_sp.AAC.2